MTSQSSQNTGGGGHHKHDHTALTDHVTGKWQMTPGLDHVWATGELW